MSVNKTLTSMHPNVHSHYDEYLQALGVKKQILTNLRLGGSIRQAINMFDEYKNVNEEVKTETIAFSLSTITMLNW